MATPDTALLHKRRLEYQQVKKYDTDFLREGWT